ncbi:hypothetical protein LWI29_017692 [Acer saccharum]|uniref:Beta-galactosidase n=1 Tax=Acer saccharum TaxID=4024 RepID=A0AA39RPU5_ACESA|nr:hypothetical protein LWI29_017692 [Acer saccharum]
MVKKMLMRRWCCWLILAVGSMAAPMERNVSYDATSLIINGQHKILFSGSIHYPRSPPQQVASDKDKDGVRWQLQILDKSKKGQVEKSAILACDGDMATHVDSYERDVVSDSPIPLNLNFENLVDDDRMDNFSNSREAGPSSDKFFQGVLG